MDQPIPPPDQGAPPMPPEQAQQVLAKFGIGPQDLPIVAQAVQVLMAAGAEQQAGPPERGALDQAIDGAMAQHGGGA